VISECDTKIDENKARAIRELGDKISIKKVKEILSGGEVKEKPVSVKIKSATYERFFKDTPKKEAERIIEEALTLYYKNK
jgi:hypothetical protein